MRVEKHINEKTNKQTSLTLAELQPIPEVMRI